MDGLIVQWGKEIQPGDVVVVPINLQKGKWLETLTSGSQIVYQLAVTAAALNSFNFLVFYKFILFKKLEHFFEMFKYKYGYAKSLKKNQKC